VIFTALRDLKSDKAVLNFAGNVPCCLEWERAKQSGQGAVYLVNCHFVQREGDPPFIQADREGRVHVHLTGYTIMPTEVADAVRA
jgi:hypothetical protein